jgi:NADH-quinone oxidoreductase subunit L
MLQLLWLIPLLPFAGFAVNGLLGARVLPRRAVSLIGCAVVLAAFVISAGAILELNLIARDPAALDSGAAPRFTQNLFEWMPMGRSETGEELRVDWSYALDPLSAVMLLVVTGVGFLIHVYSIGYMEHEPGPAFARFFAYLNLFMAMMLTLVLGASLPVVFVGWEGVGLCSYLLIGFYYDRMFDEKTKMSCADAGRKAFIVNRIGDVGFILGMLLLFAATGTLEIQGILGKVGGLGTGVCTLAALFLFIGACGKSAQIPLYVWLPDAMAGPTPVSALIHAATMVTAGVYVTCRMAPLYLQAPAAMTTVAVIGALTALFAAVIGTAQDDIKKVLAYSTVSQLGYMMLAAGVGAFSASIFHLMTHAFFKALLFLAAGSVIHAMSGEQNIKMMGGLRRHLPVTHATFLIGVLAIAGIPPFAGFFSKDEILAGVLGVAGEAGSGILLGIWVLGVVAAGLTAFYMTRLYLLVFAGEPRMSEETKHHLHESPRIMTLPLVVLAAGSALAGLLGVPEFLSHGAVPNYLEEYLAPVLHPHHLDSAVMAVPSEWTAVTITLLVSLAGIATAWLVYGRGPRRQEAMAAEPAGLVRVVKDKLYVDEMVDAVVVRPYYGLCRLATAIDEKVVDGLVNAAATTTDLFSQMARLLQTGYVRNYALFFFLATILILMYAMR